MSNEGKWAAEWLRRTQGMTLDPAALGAAEALAARQAALAIETANRSAETLPFETEPGGLLRLLARLARPEGGDGR